MNPCARHHSQHGLKTQREPLRDRRRPARLPCRTRAVSVLSGPDVAPDDTLPTSGPTGQTTKKQTAKDQAVPAVYLGPGGNFKPGYDASLKRDLVHAVLRLPNPNALHRFTAKKAQQLLERAAGRSSQTPSGRRPVEHRRQVTRKQVSHGGRRSPGCSCARPATVAPSTSCARRSAGGASAGRSRRRRNRRRPRGTRPRSEARRRGAYGRPHRPVAPRAAAAVGGVGAHVALRSPRRSTTPTG